MAKLDNISSSAARIMEWELQPSNGKRMRPIKSCVTTIFRVSLSILSTAKVVLNPRQTVIMMSVEVRADCDIFSREFS